MVASRTGVAAPSAGVSALASASPSCSASSSFLPSSAPQPAASAFSESLRAEREGQPRSAGTEGAAGEHAHTAGLRLAVEGASTAVLAARAVAAEVGAGVAARVTTRAARSTAATATAAGEVLG